MRAGSIWRIFIIAGLVSLFVSYIGIWIRFINDPVERTGADFMAFYSAARIAQEEGTANVYDLSLQQDIQEEQLGFTLARDQILPFIHPPFVVPLLKIFVTTNYIYSFQIWVLLMSVFYMIAIILLSLLLKQIGISREEIIVWIAGSFLFLPVFFSFMNGQDTAILLLGIVVWIYGLTTHRDYLAGVGLSLTTIRPHIALFLGIILLFNHRKAFAGFIFGSGILVILSLFMLGAKGTVDFFNVLQVSAGGEGYGTKENAMFNLLGVLMRTLPGVDTDKLRLFIWLTYGVTAIGLCILWHQTYIPKDTLIGLTVILALFVAPHLHFHDLALLLIPMYELVRMSRETGNLKTSIAIAVPIAISLLLLISNISPFLQYTVTYLIMLVLAIYPYYARLRTPATTLHQS